MQPKIIALAVLSACTLVACGNGGGTPGVSVNSESSTSSKNERRASLERSRDLTTGTSAKVSVEVDFSAVLGQALSEIALVTGVHQGDFYRAVVGHAHGATPSPYGKNLARPHALAGVDRALAHLGLATPSGAITAAQVLRAQAEEAQLAPMIGRSAASDVVLGRRLACVQAVLAEDYAGAQSCYREYLTQAYAMHSLLVAGTAQKGSFLAEITLADLEAKLAAEEAAYQAGIKALQEQRDARKKALAEALRQQQAREQQKRKDDLALIAHKIGALAIKIGLADRIYDGKLDLSGVELVLREHIAQTDALRQVTTGLVAPEVSQSAAPDTGDAEPVPDVTAEAAVIPG